MKHLAAPGDGHWDPEPKSDSLLLSKGHIAPVMLKPKDVAKILDVGLSTLGDMRNPLHNSYDPEFPAPVTIGKRNVRFFGHEVDNYVLTRPRAVSDVVANDAANDGEVANHG
jgi:predicted DNA-binding transcriptional regulator AlpA